MSRWFQTGERILDSNMHLNCFYSVRTLFIHTKEVRIRYIAKCLFTTCMMRQEQLNSKSLYVGTENESIAWPFSLSALWSPQSLSVRLPSLLMSIPKPFYIYFLGKNLKVVNFYHDAQSFHRASCVH